MQPVYSYFRPGFRFDVFPGSISVVEGLLFKKTTTIILRNVTGVDITRTARLRILTNDGKRYQYLLGGEAHKAQQWILYAMR